MPRHVRISLFTITKPYVYMAALLSFLPLAYYFYIYMERLVPTLLSVMHGNEHIPTIIQVTVGIYCMMWTSKRIGVLCNHRTHLVFIFQIVNIFTLYKYLIPFFSPFLIVDGDELTSRDIYGVEGAYVVANQLQDKYDPGELAFFSRPNAEIVSLDRVYNFIEQKPVVSYQVDIAKILSIAESSIYFSAGWLYVDDKRVVEIGNDIVTLILAELGPLEYLYPGSNVVDPEKLQLKMITLSEVNEDGLIYSVDETMYIVKAPSTYRALGTRFYILSSDHILGGVVSSYSLPNFPVSSNARLARTTAVIEELYLRHGLDKEIAVEAIVSARDIEDLVEKLTVLSTPDNYNCARWISPVELSNAVLTQINRVRNIYEVEPLILNISVSGLKQLVKGCE